MEFSVAARLLLIQVLQFNDPEDCESFPLQAGFRSIQGPFKMSCNVFSEESKLQSSHYVNSWPSCSLPRIFPSPLSTPSSITHVPQYPAPYTTCAITVLCIIVFPFLDSRREVWGSDSDAILGYQATSRLLDHENEDKTSASRQGVNIPKEWIFNTKKTLQWTVLKILRI